MNHGEHQGHAHGGLPQGEDDPIEREAMETAVHGHGVEHEGHNGHAPERLPATGVMAGAHAGHTMPAHPGDTAHAATHEHAAAGGGHTGHGVDHSGHEDLFRRKFWVSLLLSIPVLIYSPMIQMWLGFTPPAFPGSEWLVPVLSVIVFLYGGLPFLQMAAPELRARRPGMMTLISLAITVALVYSLATFFLETGESFFWELVTLIVIMLLGHWIEMRSVRQASGALDALATLMPDTAELIDADGGVDEVPVSALRPGDIVLVRPGARVPVDGEVTAGESAVDEAMITGESKPVDKAPGARVIAGTVNGDGSLRVAAAATGEDTALAGIMRLVREAQTSKSRTQILADRAAGLLFYVALAVAAITAIAWTIATGFDSEVVARVATVLVIACPHALGLAIPLVVAITTALGARNGILVRDRLALERARQIDTVIFDKTGTLTEGRFGVVGMATHNGWSESRALEVATGIEGDSEHSIAAGLRREAEQRAVSPAAVTGFEALKGRGVAAVVDGQTAHVGGPRLLEELKVSVPPKVGKFASEAGSRGQTVVYLVYDSVAVAAFSLADVVREESHEAIHRLQEMGVSVAMLTGDAEPVARGVAEELGISLFFAGVLPEHKDEKVSELQREGRRVAMVGDGVNDAPALARADVGIAIGSGTDVAVQSAGIILVRSNPMDVVKIIELSRASYAKMQQNLVWATGYNVVALPLAAGILAPWGIVLSPAAGAVLMSVSTIIVALNAQLLRRARLGG